MDKYNDLLNILEKAGYLGSYKVYYHHGFPPVKKRKGKSVVLLFIILLALRKIFKCVT